MSGIEELQQRVAAVEQQFGLAHEQRTKYSARLLSLMDAVETRLREQQGEIGRQADALAQRAAELSDITARSERGERENEQLRGMLHSLLQAIEAGSRDVLSEAMQALDAKVSSLIAGAPCETDPRPDSEPETPDAEAAVEDAPLAAFDPASEIPPIEEPSDEAADLDAAIADEPAAVVHEDEAVDPADHAAAESLDETAEPPAPETPSDQAATLAAIMQRVSKLIDEDEESATSEAADAGDPADPAAETEVAEVETETPRAAANT